MSTEMRVCPTNTTSKTVCFVTGAWDGWADFIEGRSSGPGGTPSSWIPWLHYKQSGYEVIVIMIGRFKKRSEFDFRGCRMFIIPWREPVSYLGINLTNFFAPFVYRRLWREICTICDTFRPRIVYALREYYFVFGWRIARRYDAVFVKRIFGTFLYGWWFVMRTLKTRLLCLPMFLYWWIPSDLTIITDDGTRGDQVAKLIKLDTNKVNFWKNGVFKSWKQDDEAAKEIREKLGVQRDDFLIISVARLDDWKRYDRAIQIMSQLMDYIPNAKLVICGDGKMRPDLEERIRRYELEDNVIMPGTIEHSEVRNYLGASDVLLLTYDTTCLCSTLLEGLICGKAIVTWDVGTTSEVIKDNINGILLDNPDPTKFVAAICKIYSDKDYRKRLEKGALNYAMKELMSWDERCQIELAAVERLVRSASRPANL